MKRLNEKELNNINGGGIGKWTLVGAIATFVIGLVNGLQRPNSCSSVK